MMLVFLLIVASVASYSPVIKPPKPPPTPLVITKTFSSSESSARASAESSSSSNASASSAASSNAYSSTNTTGEELQCGENEYLAPCKTICPPQECVIAFTEYACDPNPPCIPGCDCIKNYLRDRTGKCIFNDDCDLTQTTPPTEPPQPPSKPLKPSCIKNQSGNSASASSSSSSSSSSNSSSFSHSSASSKASSYSSTKGSGRGRPVRDCTYNKCTPTCSIPSPLNCSPDSNPCKCPPGTIVSERGGKCVQRQECQKYINCKGNYNASYTDCPIACPSTCAKPNAEFCDSKCGKLECECKPGYLLSKKNGHCIKPEDCPGGNACGVNETFVYCSVKCPNNYCPRDDSRAIIACDPPYPCPSGCTCNRNYKLNNEDENKCILATDCPPVTCTRPNEEWNSCPETCFSDYCSERNKVNSPGSCRSSGPDCQPQCVCKHGFFRNETESCVPANECPPEN